MLRFLLLLSMCANASAFVTPAQEQVSLTLATGERYVVTPEGSHTSPYLVLEDGRILVTEGSYYLLAELSDQGNPVSTGEVFGEIGGYRAIHAGEPQALAAVNGQPERLPVRYSGGFYEQPVVVVRIAFADQDFRYSDEQVAARFFGGNNSVADYYLENSWNDFSIVPASEASGTANDGVIQVVSTANHPNFGSQYGSNSSALARMAFTALEESVDLQAYDSNGDAWLDPTELGVVVLVAGYEQAYASTASSYPNVWAHRAAITAEEVDGLWLSDYAMFGEMHESHLATVGLMAHELGHLLLDLPDLYDSVGVASGLGQWGLMSTGIWNAGGGKAGDKPAHLVSWSKETAGFTQPLEVAQGPVYLSSGSADESAMSIDLDPYRHGKRILIEQRYKSGYDSGLPDSGLLITRVDDRFNYGNLKFLTSGQSDYLIGNASGAPGTDVRTDSKGVVVTSAESLELADGAVILSDVVTGVDASFTYTNAREAKGQALGHDDLPPDSTWGNYGQEGMARLIIPVGAEILSADGVDFLAYGAGYAEIYLYDADTCGDTEPLTARRYAVAQGWNRLLFAGALTLSSAEVCVEIISTPTGPSPAFVTDRQGEASGLTSLSSDGETFESAAFDVSARLLVSSESQARQSEARVVTSTDNDETSLGASVWLLLILVLFILLFRQAPATQLVPVKVRAENRRGNRGEVGQISDLDSARRHQSDRLPRR